MAQFQCTFHFPLVIMRYKCSLQGPALSLFHCLLFSTATSLFPGLFVIVFWLLSFLKIIILFLSPCHWNPAAGISFPIIADILSEALTTSIEIFPQKNLNFTGRRSHRIPFLLKAILWFLLQLSCFKASEYDLNVIPWETFISTDSQPNSMTLIFVLTKLIFKHCCYHLLYLHRWNLLTFLLLFHFLLLGMWSCSLTVCRSWYLLSFIMPVLSYRCIYSLFTVTE